MTIEKWKAICEKTLNNYIHMKIRLENNEIFSNFILIYYSVFLIIYAITPKFFKGYNTYLSDYFNIIISIVLLVFSIINGNAKYPERIKKLHDAINSLKTLKRENHKIEEFKDKYDEIVNANEMRKDRDFYLTIKKLKLYNYYQEINRFKQWMIIWGIRSLKLIIILIPIVALVLCFIISSESLITKYS